MSERPNILFLMSDEHRADVTGYEGNETVHTPTLDWLAETGVTFTNAYTPSPVCIPGRQNMMCGQLPRTCGVEKFGQDLAPFSMTFAKRFAQYAYKTVCAGKLHHLGPDQMQGWTERLAPDAEVSPPHVEGLVKEEQQRYKSPEGTGKWSNQKEVERAGIAHGRYQQFDELVEDTTHAFIRRHFLDPEYDRPQHHRPTMLKVSTLQPHYPFFTDREKFEYYLNRVPVYHNEPLFDHPALSKTQGGNDVDATERDVRRATAAYYGMVETIDQMYGDVIEALWEAGEDVDDWIIVYTSDHGEMLGEHGVWEKLQFFEGSVRVPLIIRWPKHFSPGRVHENINLCDLFATLCDLAGIPLPDDEETVNGAGLDSRSLVPLMKGENEHWDNEAVSQFGNNNLMIKQDDLKYQYYGEDVPEVLFDHAKDPNETVNYAEDPAYADTMEYFRKRRAELGHGPDADDNYINAGYRDTGD